MRLCNVSYGAAGIDEILHINCKYHPPPPKKKKKKKTKGFIALISVSALIKFKFRLHTIDKAQQCHSSRTLSLLKGNAEDCDSSKLWAAVSAQ